MKGIIFTEFLEMVEDKFGWEMSEALIEENELESNGVYTSVGTYHHAELVKMVITLSEKTEVKIPDLLRVFGSHLFGQLKEQYSVFFVDVTNTFDFLETIDNHIHVEVRKLYPNAELPKFVSERPNENQLILTYSSERPFADFAHGMLNGCIDYYQEGISIERKDLGDQSGNAAQFTLTK